MLSTHKAVAGFWEERVLRTGVAEGWGSSVHPWALPEFLQEHN